MSEPKGAIEAALEYGGVPHEETEDGFRIVEETPHWPATAVPHDATVDNPGLQSLPESYTLDITETNITDSGTGRVHCNYFSQEGRFIIVETEQETSSGQSADDDNLRNVPDKHFNTDHPEDVLFTGGRDAAENLIVSTPEGLPMAIRAVAALPAVRRILRSIFSEDWEPRNAHGRRLTVLLWAFLELTDSSKDIRRRLSEAEAYAANLLSLALPTVKSSYDRATVSDSDGENGSGVLALSEPVLSTVSDFWDSTPPEELLELTADFSELQPIDTGATIETEPTDSSIWTDSDDLTPPADVDPENPPQTPDFDLHFPEQLQTGEQLSSQIDAALRAGNHLILTGPPGSGKTQLAKQICEHYADDFTVSTATSDWTTFDTVGGYRPKTNGDGLQFRQGLFLDCLDTDDGETGNQWLVIDELNRADIDKAFGSLFTVLTGERVTLPYVTRTGTDEGRDKERRVEIIGDPKETEPNPDHRYYVPSDWRLIATMNAADKATLHRMSYAFVRRFSFVGVPVPSAAEIDPDLVGEYLGVWDVDLDDYDFSPVDLDDYASRWQKICEDLALVWGLALDQGARFGPAMIEDFLEHALAELQTTRRIGYDRALAAHVLPQFEGRKKSKVEELFNRLQAGTINGELDDALPEVETVEDVPSASQFASNNLGVDIRPDESDDSE